MNTRHSLAAVATIAFALLGAVSSACRGQSPPAMAGMPMDTTDRGAAAAADNAMSGALLMGLHMEMTPSRALRPGDSARADSVLAIVRSSLTRYRDVNAAIADGFRQFLPNVKHQPIYHFTNFRYAMEERFRFDPSKPTSLLYKEDSGGHMVLVGVMYDDAPGTALAELDRRIPLSITHWHRHVNWCVPPRGQQDRWKETKDGQPVFGPHSPIATQAACDSVGGRFFPRLFGWMVHVNAFAGTDPAVVWGGDEHGEHMAPTDH
jgi:hypothetical protein